jgi:hypothetical protein
MYIGMGTMSSRNTLTTFVRSNRHRINEMLCGMLLFCGTLSAQQVPPPSVEPRVTFGRFVIGVDAVGPSTHFPVPNRPENGGTYLHWVSGAEMPGTPCGQDDIPLVRWEQLQELGIDLASVWLSHEALLTDGVRELRQAAADHGLMLGLVDMGVADGATNYSGAERVIYHVESPLMVDTTGLRCIDDNALHLRGWDASVYPHTPWNNAVLFPCGGSPIGTLLNRAPAPAGQLPMYQGRLRRNGVYYLSLRLHHDTVATATADAIPNDTTTIFRVTISDEDAASDDTYFLRGHDFFTGGGRIDTVHEFLLDIVRVEYDEAEDRVRVVRGLISDPDNTVPDVGINLDGFIVPAWGDARIPFRIEYMPFSRRRPVIVLDAMLLSCGKAFALLNPGHPALPRRWHPTPREFLDLHIDKLCGDDGTPPASMIMLVESDGNSGNFATAGFVSDRIHEISSGHTIPFLYAPSGMGAYGMSVFTRAFSQCLQSYYFYPFTLDRNEQSVRAPWPEDADYYAFQFQVDTWHPRLGLMADDFRLYAQERTSAGIMADWIPVIQNHAYGARDGAPTGGYAPDRLWLREPTTRELRCSVNLALAYGAKGILYYLFNSTPGHDTTVAENYGAQGFLTFDHCKRAMNPYGENPWDSLRAFHRGHLRTLGDSLYPLAWETGFSVEEWKNGMLPGSVLSRVRTGDGHVFDSWDSTFIEASIFHARDVGDSTLYIFLVNKRTDASGARQVVLTLRDGLGGITRWEVRDVMQGSNMLAPALTDIDAVAGKSSCTLNIEPGMAVLLRLQAVEREEYRPPEAFAIGENFPNPAGDYTILPLLLPEDAEVLTVIFDNLGHRLQQSHQTISGGFRSVALDTSQLPSGIYQVVVRAGPEIRSRRVCVVH